MKKIIFILIILILISGCYNSNVDENLAKCIAKNSIVYISNGCVACNKQENIFGDNFKYLNLIDCTEEPEKCREDGIVRVPTWIINGEKIEGVQDIEKLKELTKC